MVTGDSESMLAEAVATGKTVYIYPLPAHPPNVKTRLREWVVNRAQKTRVNQRGTVRPQQGLAYLCARLIERGRVLPPNDVNALHQALICQGLARFFGGPVELTNRAMLRDIEEIACRVRTLVGISGECEVLSDVRRHGSV